MATPPPPDGARPGLQALADFKHTRREDGERAAVETFVKPRVNQEKKDGANKKRKAAKSAPLSFDDEEGNGNGEVAKKVFKAPGVDTSFLAKHPAEQEVEAQGQKLLLQKSLDELQQVRSQEVKFDFQFRCAESLKLLGNQFHEASVTIKRGDEVSSVLETIHPTLGSFLDRKPSSNLILVASSDILSLIVPPSSSVFHVESLRWKEGGLMFPQGARQWCVAERSFYEANRHLYPFYRWEVFDPCKEYSKEEAIKAREQKAAGVIPTKPGQHGGRKQAV